MPSSFEFTGISYDDGSGNVSLGYRFDTGEAFHERVGFGAPLPPRGSAFRLAFEAIVESLHLAAGVSYYKAFLPETLKVASFTPTPAQARFFDKLYLNGLGEFAYRNGVDIDGHFHFPSQEPAVDAEPPKRPEPETEGSMSVADLPRKSCVLVGGGKDSLVSIEMLKAADEPMVLFAVNPKRPMTACAEAAGLPLIAIERTLDPALFDLNERGAFNGHIPITAINSFIALAAAFVHGFDAVVLSNERSADEGNTRIGKRVVNHQYSKTAEFEADLQAYLRDLLPRGPRPAYFSLLRPLAEIHIANLLAKTNRYDDVFTSCNRSFKLRGDAPESRWCGTCPKCHFVFLMLATAMPPERLEKIFGRNLLDDPEQLSGYEELTGLSGMKPWECVGELAESGAALIRLAEDAAWRDFHVVSALAPRLREKMPNHEEVWASLFQPTATDLMPAHFRKILDAHV